MSKKKKCCCKKPKSVYDKYKENDINSKYDELELERQHLDNLSKRAELAKLLSQLANEEGTPYFNMDYIKREILKIDE